MSSHFLKATQARGPVRCEVSFPNGRHRANATIQSSYVRISRYKVIYVWASAYFARTKRWGHYAEHGRSVSVQRITKRQGESF